MRYGWKKQTQLVSQQQQGKLIMKGPIKDDETLLNLRDVQTGKTVLAHGGSVAWNEYRRRWIMIAVEIMGSSFLGEVWYAEADTPLGPWVYARRSSLMTTTAFTTPSITSCSTSKAEESSISREPTRRLSQATRIRRPGTTTTS